MFAGRDADNRVDALRALDIGTGSALSTSQPQDNGDLATLERPADQASPIEPAAAIGAIVAEQLAPPPSGLAQAGNTQGARTVAAPATKAATQTAGAEAAPATDATTEAAQTAASPPPDVAGVADMAPESRLRAALRNPKIAVAAGCGAILLLSAAAACTVALMHASPRGRPPAETPAINSTTEARAPAHADTTQGPPDDAAAHSPARDDAATPTPATPATAANLATPATDGQVEKATTGSPLTPQQTMEKQAQEIAALRQSLFEERAARAEAEKKASLAPQAAPAQVRKAGAPGKATGHYLEDCSVAGNSSLAALKTCVAEFKQRK